VEIILLKNNDLKNCFIDSEDSYIREINEQIQNPSEAQFKIYLYNTLKNLKDSYEFLSSTQIENNRILNLIKKELLDSYKRTYIKIKNEVPIYDDIFETFLFSNKSLKRIEQPSVDFFENKQDYNPFPRVFINNDKFLFFEEVKI
jgi:hypothetical protein